MIECKYCGMLNDNMICPNCDAAMRFGEKLAQKEPVEIQIRVPTPDATRRYALYRTTATDTNHLIGAIARLLKDIQRVENNPNAKPLIIGQSRTDSFMEAVCNTLIGFWISVAANYAILPLFGYTPKFIDSMAIAALFTVVSLVRSYILRRLFNGRSVWEALKSRWS